MTIYLGGVGVGLASTFSFPVPVFSFSFMLLLLLLFILALAGDRRPRLRRGAVGVVVSVVAGVISAG